MQSSNALITQLLEYNDFIETDTTEWNMLWVNASDKSTYFQNLNEF